MQKRISKLFTGILLLFAIVTGIQRAQAQNATDFRFNEILVLNDSNYVDDFGKHSPWIEIFNSAFNSVDIGGCYLTDDSNNPTKYWIPSGNPKTIVPPQNYIVFWADNQPSRGIFHLNFELNENSKFIALYDASGKSMIDKVEIKTVQKVNIPYGKPTIDAEVWDYLDKSTPGSNNDVTRQAASGEKFVEMDPTGLGMTFIAMFVVFSALAILYLVYKTTGRFFMRKANAAKLKETTDEKSTSSHKPQADQEMSGEVNAAIAMALYMYQNEMHDYENTVLTIKKVSRAYSPWSSKIYTLRKSPR